jgi:hypothetical protein
MGVVLVMLEGRGARSLFILPVDDCLTNAELG